MKALTVAVVVVVDIFSPYNKKQDWTGMLELTGRKRQRGVAVVV